MLKLRGLSLPMPLINFACAGESKRTPGDRGKATGRDCGGIWGWEKRRRARGADGPPGVEGLEGPESTRGAGEWGLQGESEEY